jgi:hypothetical protein
MPTIQPTPVMDRDQDVQDYKPLALLAVAAFGVSLVFAGVVLVLTIVGLVSRKPFLEPWLIPLAFSGVLLSIAARWQISLSEGTREGRRLTKYAWWMSLVGGAMYAAYYFGNVAAIQGQARRYAEGALFDKLREQKFDAAYYATMPPNQRKGMNTMAEMQKRFGDVVAPYMFEPLPRLYARANGMAEVEYQGTASWAQKAEGLTVTLRYFIKTPEGSFETLVPVIGKDNLETGEREWYVDRAGCGLKAFKLTRFGGLLSDLQEEADSFLTTWLGLRRHPYRRADVFLDTRPISREDRKRQNTLFVVRACLAQELANLLSAPTGGWGILSYALTAYEYDRTLLAWMPEIVKMNGDLVKWDEHNQKQSAEDKAKMLPFMLEPDTLQLQMMTSTLGTAKTRMEVLPNRIRASIPLEVSLPFLKYRCTGRIFAECTDRKLVEELNQLKGTMEQGQGDEATAMLKSTPHSWTLTEIVVDLARDMSDMRPPNASDPGMKRFELNQSEAGKRKPEATDKK